MKEIAGITPQAADVKKLATLTQDLQKKRITLDALMQTFEKASNDEQKAELLARDVAPAMIEVRGICDEIEASVADDAWPMPKYREMLFLG